MRACTLLFLLTRAACPFGSPSSARTDDLGQQADGEQVIGVGEEAPARWRARRVRRRTALRVCSTNRNDCQAVCPCPRSAQRAAAARSTPTQPGTHMPATTMAWETAHKCGSGRGVVRHWCSPELLCHFLLAVQAARATHLEVEHADLRIVQVRQHLVALHGLLSLHGRGNLCKERPGGGREE